MELPIINMNMGVNQDMPRNRSESYNQQQNKDSMMEESQTLKPNKAKEFPPSLNQIDKHINE